MRWLKCSVIVLASICDVAPANAREAIPWFGVSGAFGTYSMADVNDDIRNIDAQVAVSFDEINNGFGFGVDGGVDVAGRARLAVHYMRIFAGSDVADPSGSVDYSFPANAFFASVEYLPEMESSFSVGFGVSGGVVVAAGTVTATVTGEGSVRSLTYL